MQVTPWQSRFGAYVNAVDFRRDRPDVAIHFSPTEEVERQTLSSITHQTTDLYQPSSLFATTDEGVAAFDLALTSETACRLSPDTTYRLLASMNQPWQIPLGLEFFCSMAMERLIALLETRYSQDFEDAIPERTAVIWKHFPTPLERGALKQRVQAYQAEFVA